MSMKVKEDMRTKDYGSFKFCDLTVEVRREKVSWSWTEIGVKGKYWQNNVDVRILID